MSIRFQCSACGHAYELREELAGKRVKCKCGERTVVPPPDVAGTSADLADPIESLFDEEFSGAGDGRVLAPAATPASGPGAKASKLAVAGQGQTESRGAKAKKETGSSGPRTGLIVAGAAIAGVLLLGLIIYLLTWKPKPGFATPQEAFAAHQQAIAGDDWAAQFSTYTPNSQELLAAKMLIFAIGRDKTGPEVRGALEKHGLQNLLDGETPKDTAALPQTLVVDDRAALFADLVTALDALEERKAYNPVLKAIARKARIAARQANAAARLSDVAITGITASGTVTVTTGSRTVETPIVFQRIDGRWLIDLSDESGARNVVLGIRAPFP